jgi:short-subunit dehydrogenase
VSFAARYGPWALIAGASEGIGAAFAQELTARGVGVVLVARREQPLAELAARLGDRVRTVVADLSTMEGLAVVADATAELEVGLVVCNAAAVAAGPLLAQPEAALLAVVDTNVRATVLLARRHLPAMVARGRGGLIVMSSLAGQQGTAELSSYAASKAFGAVFAESLWAELRPHGVAVLACLAGAVGTPGYSATMAKPAPGTVDPQTVARVALRALGRRPRVVPGALMRIAAPVMARLLPRRTAITVMGRGYRAAGGGDTAGTA